MNSQIKLNLYGLFSFLLRITGYLPFHFLRKFLYKCAGLTIGRNSWIYGLTELRAPSRITIGSGSIVGEKCILDGRSNLTIGDNCNISTGVYIWTLHHDINCKNFSSIGAEVKIDDYTWICSRAIILPGITIGKGAVVASGSVVTKSVPEFSIVGGVPAKIIGKRECNPEYTLGSPVPFI